MSIFTHPPFGEMEQFLTIVLSPVGSPLLNNEGYIMMVPQTGSFVSSCRVKELDGVRVEDRGTMFADIRLCDYERCSYASVLITYEGQGGNKKDILFGGPKNLTLEHSFPDFDIWDKRDGQTRVYEAMDVSGHPLIQPVLQYILCLTGIEYFYRRNGEAISLSEHIST